MLADLQALARALGGEVIRNQVLAPLTAIRARIAP
jgi:hypothetical protein